MLEYSIDGNTIRISNVEFTSAALVNQLQGIDPENRASYLAGAIEFGLNTLATVSTQAEIRELESAAKRVKTALQESEEDVIAGVNLQFKNQLDEQNPMSLISVFKRSILTSLREELDLNSENSAFASIAHSLEEILKAFDKQAERKRVEAKTPIKGNDFQLDVDALIKEVGARHGDQVEFVGSDGGGSSQKGDTLVTFNPQLTNLRREFKVAWECKTQADFKSKNGMLKQSKVHAELEEAIKLRDADCAIFVADSDGLENQPEFQEFNGNKLMLVLDRENPDLRLVTLAYLWSKGVAYRSATNDGAFDFSSLGNLLTRLKAAVDSIRNLKTAHTAINKGLEDARAWVKDKEDDFKELVQEIEAILQQDGNQTPGEEHES